MATSRSVLIVDDERDIRELLVLTLGRMGLRPDTAANLADARNQLAQNKYDMCLTDMRLPDGDGLELVAEISKHYPETPVAMITAYGNVEIAVDALKAGAFDFVSKPVDINVLRGLIQRALDLGERAKEQPPISATARSGALGQLSGDSPAMHALRDTIAKVARSQAPVHIHGESGTGKELVARTIHSEGGRANGPFVPVNCGAIPAELMESEFFGHKKGSFTGAHADKTGLFQAAQGGTLFLDEIGELPLPMQVKLLRAIQEKSVRPVGGNAEIPVDVRILSATHKDLAQLVNDGRFRHDLYYRINVIEMQVPPLRDRGNDMQLLANGILKRMTPPGQPLPTFSPDASAAMRAYSFPGNVRELENVLERALAMADGDVITSSDLRLPSHNPIPTHPVSQIPAPPQAAQAAPVPQPAATAYVPVPPPAQHTSPQPQGVDPSTLSPYDTASSRLPEYMEQLERKAIEQALQENRYNKTKTASALGITFRALRYKLKKLGID